MWTYVCVRWSVQREKCTGRRDTPIPCTRRLGHAGCRWFVDCAGRETRVEWLGARPLPAEQLPASICFSARVDTRSYRGPRSCGRWVSGLVCRACMTACLGVVRYRPASVLYGNCRRLSTVFCRCFHSYCVHLSYLLHFVVLPGCPVGNCRPAREWLQSTGSRLSTCTVAPLHPRPCFA